MLGGIEWKPTEKFELGIDAVWATGDGTLDPFTLSVPADYLERNPNQSFDFSLTNTNSDLDFTRVELGLSLRYEFREAMAFWGGYRHVDYDDDSPYLYDTTGSIDYVTAGLAWTF